MEGIEGLAKRFFELFRGSDRAHGTYIMGEKDPQRGKVGGQARTLRDGVTVVAWEAHLAGRMALGVVPIREDATCVFGAVDVDVYTLDLNALEAQVREMGLPLVLCRTKSGGAHLYLFLTEPLEAGTVRHRLMEWAVALGYAHSEVFPKQARLAGPDDLGSWINMPYFDGVPGPSTRYAIRDGRVLSAEEFLGIAEGLRLDARALAGVDVKVDVRFKDGPPCLQHLANRGFPQGVRNSGLSNLGRFAKKAFGDAWEEKVWEWNKEFMKPPLPDGEVKSIIASLKKKAYAYSCKDEPLVGCCNRSICVQRPHGIHAFGSDPGVVYDGLTKILTDPPIWIVSVNGQRMVLPDTQTLVDQSRFVTQCVEALNIMPRRVKREDWDNIIRGLLEKPSIVDAPKDASPAGQFLYLFESFLSDRLPTGPDAARAKEIERLLHGCPWINEGVLWFRSTDVLMYAERHKLKVSAKEAWSILSPDPPHGLGAKQGQHKIKGKNVRAWGVLLKELSLQEESFTVPKANGNGEEQPL